MKNETNDASSVENSTPSLKDDYVNNRRCSVQRKWKRRLTKYNVNLIVNQISSNFGKLKKNAWRTWDYQGKTRNNLWRNGDTISRACVYEDPPLTAWFVYRMLRGLGISEGAIHFHVSSSCNRCPLVNNFSQKDQFLVAFIPQIRDYAISSNPIWQQV